MIIYSDDQPTLDIELREWVYNGLDCCLTQELQAKIPEPPGPTYAINRALQAPALEMMLRGIRVDFDAREEILTDIEYRLTRLDQILQTLADVVWSAPLNPNSPKQLIEFFYERMKIKPIIKYDKGNRRVTTDRDALEKIASKYMFAAPIVRTILAMRDLRKRQSVLRKNISPDGRIRTSYNIAGTETGRWSSSTNAFHEGDNLQNWEDFLRRILISDPGMKFAYIDLEQAESRAVAYLSGDEAYIEACESGDLHTTVCKMVWPGLPWTGRPDDKKKVAGLTFYRDMTYRDMAKRGGHGCLTPDHEVLTRSGWVSITEKPSEIMVFKDMKLQWGIISHWEDKEWEGTLVSLRGTSLSQDLTDDHRVVFVRDNYSPILHEEPAGNFSKRGMIPLGAGFSGTKSVPEAKLIAAFQCDGYQKSQNRVEFHFHKERKVRRLQMLCDELGLKMEAREDKYIVHWHCPYPKQAGAYLLDWDAASLVAYYKEHAMWDGHQSDTATSISSTDRKHLEWLQTVGRLVGFGGNIQKPQVSGFGSTTYRLQQNKRKFATKASIAVTKKPYKGRVLCPTVPGGAFLTRKDGKISVTGNTNYLGTAPTMAKHLHVPTSVIETFQNEYFSAFPGIREWQLRTIHEVQTKRVLETPLGFRRTFFGRPEDSSTWREAVAFRPQSMVGQILNIAMYRVWSSPLPIQLVAQLHDAILIQYPENLETEIIPQVLSIMEFPVPVGDREMTIPCEAATGWNWGKYSDDNPDGIKTYTGTDARTRQRAPTSLLDRRVS